MKDKKIFLVFSLCFWFLIFGFSFSFAQTKTLKNIGFAQTSIWYGKDPFFAGDRIRVYTTVINSSKYDFRGDLEFYANSDLLGKSNFSLVSGGFSVLWADWTAQEGQKKIYAKISDPRISLAGEKEETVVLENTKTGEIETFVDKDTDRDGIGDKVDTDDDNDKVSDIVEQKQGTNPLVGDVVKETNQSGFIKESEKSVTEIPASKEIAESAKGAITIINSFLDEQKEKAKAKKEEFQKQLGEGESLFEFDFGNLLGKKEDEEGGVATNEGENKNLLKLYLLALSALIFALEYKAIIYLFGIYIAYRILKFFLKKLFFRSVDN